MGPPPSSFRGQELIKNTVHMILGKQLNEKQKIAMKDLAKSYMYAFHER